MEKIDIIKSILSKDEARLVEAKSAIKTLLDAYAAEYRQDTTKLVTKLMFERRGNEGGTNTLQHLSDLHSNAKNDSETSGVEDAIKKHHGEEALGHIRKHSEAIRAFKKSLYGGKRAEVQKHVEDAHNHLVAAKAASEEHKKVTS